MYSCGSPGGPPCVQHFASTIVRPCIGRPHGCVGFGRGSEPPAASNAAGRADENFSRGKASRSVRCALWNGPGRPIHFFAIHAIASMKRRTVLAAPLCLTTFGCASVLKLPNIDPNASLPAGHGLLVTRVLMSDLSPGLAQHPDVSITLIDVTNLTVASAILPLNPG